MNLCHIIGFPPPPRRNLGPILFDYIYNVGTRQGIQLTRTWRAVPSDVVENILYSSCTVDSELENVFEESKRRSSTKFLVYKIDLSESLFNQVRMYAAEPFYISLAIGAYRDAIVCLNKMHDCPVKEADDDLVTRFEDSKKTVDFCIDLVPDLCSIIKDKVDETDNDLIKRIECAKNYAKLRLNKSKSYLNMFLEGLTAYESALVRGFARTLLVELGAKPAVNCV